MPPRYVVPARQGTENPSRTAMAAPRMSSVTDTMSLSVVTHDRLSKLNIRSERGYRHCRGSGGCLAPCRPDAVESFARPNYF